MAELTKEWLLKTIAELEEERDATPGAVNEDAAMALAAMKIALASLEAEPYGYVHKAAYEQAGSCGLSGDHEAYRDSSTHIAVYTTPPAPVSVPDEDLLHMAASAIEDLLSNKDRYCAGVWADIPAKLRRAAMLQGAEPVTTDYKLPFDQWLSQQTGTIDVECGCVMTEVFFHWLRVAYEAGNYPVIPDGWKLVPIDPTKDMLRAGQQVVGFWLNTVHCYSKMLAAAPAAPQQEA